MEYIYVTTLSVYCWIVAWFVLNYIPLAHLEAYVLKTYCSLDRWRRIVNLSITHTLFYKLTLCSCVYSCVGCSFLMGLDECLVIHRWRNKQVKCVEVRMCHCVCVCMCVCDSTQTTWSNHKFSIAIFYMYSYWLVSRTRPLPSATLDVCAGDASDAEGSGLVLKTSYWHVVLHVLYLHCPFFYTCSLPFPSPPPPPPPPHHSTTPPLSLCLALSLYLSR